MRRGTRRSIAAVGVLVLGLAGASLRSDPPARPQDGEREPASRAGTDLASLQLPRLASEGDGAAQPGASTSEAVIAPPPPVFAEPPEPPAPPPPTLHRFRDVVATGGTWAVIIGVNDYPGSRHDLRSAVNDAHDVNEALARMGVPGDHRLLIRDRQATAEVVRTAAEWLVAHASPDATAVFFYAGHVRKEGGREAIVAADGALVFDRDLAGIFSNLRARRAWFGIAACYAAGFDELMGPGRILTAAASANSLAYENLDYGRSYLVEFMVRRGWLEGASGITVEEAFEYARGELSRQHPGRVPVQFDAVDGLLDLRAPGAPAPRRTPPPPPSPPPSSPPPTQPPPPEGGGESPPEREDSCSTLTAGVIRCG